MLDIPGFLCHHLRLLLDAWLVEDWSKFSLAPTSTVTNLRTFALIVSAHPYCARKFTCHVMHQARVLNNKINNDRADGQCYSFTWINDLGCTVTPTLLFINRFYLQLSPHCPKMNKKSMWEGKKIHNFCQRDIKSCHHAAAKRVKLWSLNANLFSEEPHQLTKFA